MIKRTMLFIAGLLLSTLLLAQERQGGTSMADTFRSNGKIYVVVAVILTIFAGLILYLVRLEKKINKLEQNHS